MIDVTDNEHRERRSRSIRTAILLGLTAAGVYALYILLVYRAGPGAG